jgi:Domain of unknown function (DUF4345)
VRLSRRQVQIGLGLVGLVLGGVLVMSPLAVAEALGRPHDTSSRMINLRASWGGMVMGLAAFVAWLPALRPWLRSLTGVLTWAMAGVGLARAVGFVLDGHPDARQYVWITGEIVIVVLGSWALRVIGRRSRHAAVA